jgi:hypothetical protein
MMRNHLIIFFCHFLLTSSLFSQNCGCIPLLYEGFDYPEGDNMHQKVGGTGWANAWNSQTGDQRVGFRVGTNTLAYSNLRSNYKAFVGGHYWHRIGRTLDVSATGALAAYRKDNGLLGKAGTTLWTSAVFQKTQNNQFTPSFWLFWRSQFIRKRHTVLDSSDWRCVLPNDRADCGSYADIYGYEA